MMCIQIETFHVSVIVPNAMGFYLVVFAQHGDNKAGIFQFHPVPCVCYIENYGKCCPGCWHTNFPFYLTTISVQDLRTFQHQALAFRVTSFSLGLVLGQG